jgi:hypothetical protein
LTPSRRDISRILFASPLLAPGLVRAQALVGPPGNVFISPCGQPFRAKMDAPYPVIDWFKQVDKNADGKIDHAEFTADSEAFFHVLDVNHDGFLSPYEVNNYETKICPEVLGGRVDVSHPDLSDRPRLWLAQYGGQGGPGGGHGGGAPPMQAPPSQSPRTPAGVESTQGASPFSFFDEPEPVAAADVRFRGIISKADFLHLSDTHFDALDVGSRGFLTFDRLPRTPVQRRLERENGKRHRR